MRIEKCSFAKPESKFLGRFLFQEMAVDQTPKKIQAIVDMPAPKDPKQLKSFLGMINYYSSFAPEIRAKKAGDGFSEEEIPHRLGGGGVVGDIRTELAMLIRS